MPRHFSKMMNSPYFQSEHYKNESANAQIEAKIEKKISLFIDILKFKRHKAKQAILSKVLPVTLVKFSIGLLGPYKTYSDRI